MCAAIAAERPLDTALPGERPLLTLADALLEERFAAAIAAGDGVAGAHCLHELWMRGAMPTRVERGLEALWLRTRATIPDWMPMRYVAWLPRAYEISAHFRGAASGISNIYLVLLDYRDRRGEDYGVYVGMSRYAPSDRFDQHKAGIRAAGSVLKRGLEVLTGPVLHLQHVRRQDAKRIEAALAEALAIEGLIVEGGH